MDEIKNYFEKGVLFETFLSKINLIIWRKILDEAVFLNTQTKETKQLYSYIQQSATVNFILHATKLFDKPNHRHPTRCISSFLKLVKDKAALFPNIVETTTTIKLLNEFNAPEELINSVNSENPTLFPLSFYNYYKTKYDSTDIQNKINNLKETRDKKIAHNEFLKEPTDLNPKSLEDLLDFAIEIISIFRHAYYNGSIVRINNDAERSAFFITDNINRLKK